LSKDWKRQACRGIKRRLLQKLKKEAFAEAMDSQLATKSDLLEMENRLIKWGIGLALGQIAIIAALVKLL